ncbi:MAG: polymerase protein [Candidatus Amesbacteria bacterium GW2011_GWA1_48_9]|uniref:Polymerase protein n=1 Tax=Candidatus Amesbacteria bacterium GW2011_GWA1_48_9 TaxID=1618355 RepID=A0A0G1XC97_9BACT|nr:MAG: polymerase protein [Candidatus Amesbacteria bacterium GW2011_GWA1_48_9]
MVIITGDRDLMQLVNKQVKLYMPQKGLSDGIIIDEQKVIEKLGVNPDQVVDYKALVGDSSDNYPGVTGVGPRGAIDLISNYTNFENIYENLENIKETVRKKLADGYEGGRLSRGLAKIRTDVPVSLEWERAQIPSQEKILDVLKELGYKSLIKRIGGEDQVDDNQQKLFE